MTEVSIPKQEIPGQTEVESPEYKIFDLLSSVGNAENKALELIVMRKGVIYSKYAFYQEVMDHQGGGGWRMNEGVPFYHCQQSFSPIGLVTKEALSSDGEAWGYQITEHGLKIGIPFAGLLLKWSNEHPEYSLYKMFGATASSAINDEQSLNKKRAQETRYKIFWEITTNPSNRIRLTDIVNQINENSGLTGQHLTSLSRNNIISYDVFEQGKPFSYFKLKESIPNQKPRAYSGQKTLSAKVFDLLIQLRQEKPDEFLSVEEIADSFIKIYPESSEYQKPIALSMVSCLTDFERQGYVERKKFAHEFRSEITLSDEQREGIVSLVTLIDKFKNGESLAIEEGRKFAQKAANDPKLFSELMLKAKENSPHANATDREDTQAYFLTILHEHSNSTASQIRDLLEENYDKKIGRHRVMEILKDLVGKEKVVCEKTKSGNVYRPAKDAKN